MKKIFAKFIGLFAKAVINKYRPIIIGITGSVGKTTTKEMISTVLSSQFDIRKNVKNYNNELGLPLTIFGLESPGSSVFGWLKVLKTALNLIIKKQDYPKVLVLEMGADHSGDIEYLLKIAPVDVGVLTTIGEAHIEFFKTKEDILKEKQKIVFAPSLKRAVINLDDELIAGLEDRIKANLTTYGLNSESMVRASELSISGLDGIFVDDEDIFSRNWGMSFKIHYDGSAVPFFLPKILGIPGVESALVAVAVGLHMGMNLIEISQALKEHQVTKGRLNLIAGKKQSLIIDDTYNASPRALEAALASISFLNIYPDKTLVLGSMLELGREADEYHYQAGFNIGKAGINKLVAVGQYSSEIVSGYLKAGGKKENTFVYENSIDASEAISGIITEGSCVLVKGSQGSRMEYVVKALMLNPDLSEEKLVRQSGEWI